MILKYVLTFLAGFVTITLGDFVWLGIVTKNLIIREFGSLVEVVNGSIKIRLGVGLFAWAIIVIGCMIFATFRSSTPQEALLWGALFGGISYAIYDLTNLTFIKGYSTLFTVIDISWGIVLCSMVSIVMFYTFQYLSKTF